MTLSKTTKRKKKKFSRTSRVREKNSPELGAGRAAGFFFFLIHLNRERPMNIYHVTHIDRPMCTIMITSLPLTAPLEGCSPKMVIFFEKTILLHKLLLKKIAPVLLGKSHRDIYCTVLKNKMLRLNSGKINSNNMWMWSFTCSSVSHNVR